MIDEQLIAYYESRYRYSYLLKWILAADVRQLESARDAYWYMVGNYERYNCDRHGITYTTYTETESELDDLLEDELVKEQQKYGY